MIDQDSFIVERPGKGTSPETFVFVSGIRGKAWSFDGALECLPKKARILRTNTPEGDVLGIDGPKTLECVVGMLAKECDERDVKNATVVGHSMGGFVVQALAKERPDIVRKMALAGTSYGGTHTSRDAFVNSFTAFRAVNAMYGFRDFDRAFFGPRSPMYFSDSFIKKNPESAALFREKMKEVPYCPRQFSWGSCFSSASFIEDITQPALVIHGQEDKIVSVEGGKKLVESLPNASYWEIPGCGHMPMIEQEESFYKNILAFHKGKPLDVQNHDLEVV